MSDRTTGVPPMPPGRSHLSRERSPALRALGFVLAVAVGSAAVVGAGYGVLSAFNPVADEWVCSQGEVPAAPAPVRPGTGIGGCYDDQALPAGYEADPFGNRPMPYNCEKDGWVLVERAPEPGPGPQCVRDDLVSSGDLPAGWRVRQD